MITYKILSPTWVWLFDDEPNRGVREVYGAEAVALIEQLEAQPKQEGGRMELRKPVKKLLRPLTPHEERLTLMLNTSTHFTLHVMDQLKLTSLYRQKLKLTANAFLKELEAHASDVLWVPGPIQDGESEQLDFLMARFYEVMMIALASTDVPDGLRPLYSVEMNRVFERFQMNVRFGPEGELRVVERIMKSEL